MEEDVKKCETLLGSERWVLGTQDKKALENLIKGYREKEEILNKLLKYEDDLRIREIAFYKENSIPKSKIKEKIEELEEERKKKDEENTIDVFYDQIDITHIIEVLQELLGDE